MLLSCGRDKWRLLSRSSRVLSLLCHVGRTIVSLLTRSWIDLDPSLTYQYEGTTPYETETRVCDALAALIPEEELLNPDHRLFQISHLIPELAWCQMHFEFRRVIAELRNGDYILAGRLLARVAELAYLPVVATRILLRALPQYGMLDLRSKLTANASGLDSPGGKNLRVVSAAVWRAFESAVNREGVVFASLAKNVARPIGQPTLTAEEAGLTTVYEGLYKVDSKFTEWRQVHLRLVWAQLGGLPGTDADRDTGREIPASMRGRPISDLERMAERPLFPKLWAIISENFRDMGGVAYGVS